MSADLPRGEVLIGDAQTTLRTLPDASIDMVLTSPPYFRLRDYGREGQIGLEPHVDDWVHQLLPVMQELRRILRPTGSLWLNLGDTYATHPREGAERKSLLLGPERLALAMVAAGWVLRNKIVWAKTNPRPTSVPDRLACTWEPVYLFAAGQRAFFDLDAIRQPHRTPPPRGGKRGGNRSGAARRQYHGPNSDRLGGLTALKAQGRVGHPLGKNPGDVWQLATGGLRIGHHPAVFPPALAERAILAAVDSRLPGTALHQLPDCVPAHRPTDRGDCRTRSVAPPVQLPRYGRRAGCRARPVPWCRYDRSGCRDAWPRLGRHRAEPGICGSDHGTAAAGTRRWNLHQEPHRRSQIGNRPWQRTGARAAVGVVGDPGFVRCHGSSKP